MTRREVRRFTALVEELVAPGGDLPPVRDTDALAAFDAWLRAAPRVNALVLRALLLAGVGQELLRRLAGHCYYGDPGVLLALGYDADAVVARAARHREAAGS